MDAVVESGKSPVSKYRIQPDFFVCLFVCNSHTADGSQHARLPIPSSTTLLSSPWSRTILSSLPGSELHFFTAMQVQHSCLISRQPMVEVYLLTFSRFPLQNQNMRSYPVEDQTNESAQVVLQGQSIFLSRLTRDGTAEPVSRDHIFRRERGQGKTHFSFSAVHEQDW